MNTNKHLKRMYTPANTGKAPVDSAANPNRVAGGLRGHGADHYSLLGEDGLNKEVPTKKYVDALEQQLRTQRTLVEALQKKVNRQDNENQTTRSMVQSLSNRLLALSNR
jgi:hypothetical protein